MASSIVYFILPVAFLLDLLIGDPRVLPHPVRWMGRAIAAAEPAVRRRFRDPLAAGAALTLSLVVLTWLAATAAVALAGAVHPLAGALLEVVLVFYAVSVKSLKTAALDVARALSGATLSEARQTVARIVGRDTGELSRGGVARAAVETVAENLVDGVVSPLFFAAIGGAPLATAFKMVSTLDSMIGYKNERYLRFGKVAARLDDAANFLPARLCAPVIALAAQLLFRTGRRSLATAARDGRHHTSPNAGIPEAAFAGALGVRLGGPNFYHGVSVDKPYIGEDFGEADAGHITRACDLMVLSAVLWLAAAWTLQVVLLF